ncbi:winged helix-turn-helix domain-containing protein [Pseudomonas sp. CFBP 13711]|uniref:ATP-binding protein n=1 Tax=unclassified Pseudomonas TaxID=196821 RepID=UPI00177DA058|nr:MULTISPECIES: winged helix-turn-helix domain-containing protein [unclassified Pseudomonas]MBD8705986.1 winged helix-turn-helix domain-containing protein [Pseudomonas sp. CFBP 13711]MBD8711884.1 winged helix-turn-helix domain-containing protein [Pseudomonas sp. CFBP 13715]
MISLGQTMISREHRDVFKDGVAMRIGTRAFDILDLLLRHQGQLVSKELILQSVWPDTVVEENNLQVHISALRKALGTDREQIRTVPGRGYVLLGGDGAQTDTRASVVLQGVSCHHPLPARVALLGRQALLDEVSNTLAEGCALVTLIGPGGVGKTALAAELGQTLLEAGTTPVYFVPLAQLQCAELLLEAFSSAVGLDCSGGYPDLQGLIRYLQQQPGLIILDNCEHLVESVASLLEVILRGAPAVRAIATSREPLRIAGERSLQVPPLDIPELNASPDTILRSASAQLFLRQWRALDSHLAADGNAELDDYSVELVGEICRRLDGMPLALEMAAARACALGLYQLVASLDGSLHLLSASLRTAPPRQQTLQASLAWSLRLLGREERTVLRRLAELDGRFTLERACDALQRTRLPRACVMDCIVRLATKSLLMVSAQGPFRFYRMLGTTRACLLTATAQDTVTPELSVPRVQDCDAPSALATLQSIRAVPAGPDGYHARHQRALAVGS